MPVTLPRRERPRNPQGSLAKLVKAAQNAVRQVEVPLLARDRLSLADALGALRAFGRRLRTFTFRGIPAQDWGEQTTYFAALLEGVKFNWRSFPQYMAALDSWQVEPVERDGDLLAVVMRKGDEFHFITFGKRISREVIRSVLAPQFRDYGRVTTRTPKV